MAKICHHQIRYLRLMSIIIDSSSIKVRRISNLKLNIIMVKSNYYNFPIPYFSYQLTLYKLQSHQFSSIHLHCHHYYQCIWFYFSYKNDWDFMGCRIPLLLATFNLNGCWDRVGSHRFLRPTIFVRLQSIQFL